MNMLDIMTKLSLIPLQDTNTVTKRQALSDYINKYDSCM